MQFLCCGYGDSAKRLSFVAGKARLYVGSALEKRCGEQERGKKGGDRNVQEMKKGQTGQFMVNSCFFSNASSRQIADVSISAGHCTLPALELPCGLWSS